MRTSHRSALAALAGFGLLTLVVFRPTPSELAHTTPSVRGHAADALLLMWATSHVSETLFTYSGRLFDAGIFHPSRRTLAYGDHMIGQALIGLPVWLATGNPLLEYNLLVLASYVLGAAAMFLYAREQVGSVAGAVVAAVVFAFTPFRFCSPLWLQVLFTAFMPLALLFWLRFVRELRWRDWAAWVGCWTAHALMGMYLAIYFGLAMGAVALWALVAGPTRGTRRLWVGTLAAPAVVLLLLAPVLWPYLELRLVQGHVREVGLGTPPAFFLPGPGTLTWTLGGLTGPVQFGPGLVAAVLTAAGLFAGRGRRRTDSVGGRLVWGVHATGLLATLALVLAPIGLALALPGLDMLRNTNRAFFITLLFAGVFAALAVARVEEALRAPRGRRVAGVALVALALVDMGAPWRERRRLPVGAEVAPVYGWVRALPAGEVIYEQTIGIEGPALAMYHAIFHGRRMATGYSGFVSPGAAYVTHRLFAFPDPAAIALLRDVGIRYVVRHFAGPGATERFVAALPPEVEVAARFGTAVVLRVAARPRPEGGAEPRREPLDRAGWAVEASAHAPALGALVDGDPASLWGAQVPRGSASPWVRVDLGSLRAIAGVRCTPGRPDSRGIHLARVELSRDGRAWESVAARFVPDSLTTLIERPAAVRYYEARFEPRAARYLRLTNPDLAFWGGSWEVGELDVLGGAG